ncbi:hypothetical protein BC835DRAFT_612792 [Cytidiella melzeri]|nr:hypothetical protein BC835DRAFT_612792 [Cytidiella melzeri]
MATPGQEPTNHESSSAQPTESPITKDSPLSTPSLRRPDTNSSDRNELRALSNDEKPTSTEVRGGSPAESSSNDEEDYGGGEAFTSSLETTVTKEVRERIIKKDAERMTALRAKLNTGTATLVPGPPTNDRNAVSRSWIKGSLSGLPMIID